METHLGKKENNLIKQKVSEELFKMHNSIITSKVEEVIESKQKAISYYVNTIKIHPLTDFTLDSQYTSLESASKLVIEENTKIFIPTVKTIDLIKELAKRFIYAIRFKK
jgi:hypothetical protein